jgi:hypothetical protein
MIERLLQDELEPVARRHRQLRRLRRLTLCWAAGALAVLGLLVLYRLTGWWSAPAFFVVVALSGGAGYLIWRRSRSWQPDYKQISRLIEERHPQLHQLLLTAVEQKPDPLTGKLNFLQERVVREALNESSRHQWLETVSTPKLLGLRLVHFAAMALLLVLVMFRPAVDAPLLAQAEAAWVVHLTPGDAEVERGSPMVILARFDERAPGEATLVIVQGETARRLPLARNLNDPIFGATLSEVTDEFVYFIEYAGEQSSTFKVKTFEHPRLARADAELVYPEYTGMDSRRINDTRRISAVEGTLLNASFHLNKPVAKAWLAAKNSEPVPLQINSGTASVALEKFPLETSRHYELHLVDAEGRKNKVPSHFVVDVLNNRTPEFKITFPRGDQRVSALQEILFEAEVWDDFGIPAYGFSYSKGGGEIQSVVLGTNAAARERRSFQHELNLEELAAEPNQLIAYFFWAEDVGPDGEVRRSSSDMFFAEVRPFEEIYRQGQGQPPGGGGEQMGGGTGNQTEQLAELQKQIINATWKLQRQERSDKPSASYAKDAQVVHESQQNALAQAVSMKARITDPEFLTLMERVEQQMGTAIEHLEKAVQSPRHLPAALAAEQAAYQALLHMQAREFEVSQAQSQQGGGGGGQRNQQQLDQLELNTSSNRYETQRQASRLQTSEPREDLQVLSRLKELAQRQNDLNERLKDLQTALQEARTEAEREELRRQLKRLRDEEREMLADVDELRQRMDRPENQSRMAEAREQLDQIRSEVERASEALEQNSVSEALTAGTRAQRELQELRDDFRERRSSQFAEQMSEMREQAREMARNQEQLGSDIEELAQTRRRTLRDDAGTRELAERVQEQRNSVTNLLNSMTEVSQESEQAEPLLSRQLYDAVRRTSQSNLDESLANSRELLRLNFLSEAGEFERRARNEVEELRRGVERAAESVLGNEAEALRQARRELDDLTRQLADEIARSAPQLARNETGSEARGEQANPEAQRSRSGNGSAQESGEQARSGAQTTEEPGQAGRGRGQQQGSEPGDGNEPGERAQTASGRQSQGDPNAEQNGEGARGEASDGGAQQGASRQSAQSNASDRSGSPDGSGGGGASPSDNAMQSEAGAGDAALSSDSSRRGGSRSALGQDGFQSFFEQSGATGPAGNEGPLTGSAYSAWSDRLRDVEEMLGDPALRNEATRIRERARDVRAEFKRHSKEPQWEMVQKLIAEPLVQLRTRVMQELARHEDPDSLVPLDRDPVPARFSDLVRRYYEQLGSGE